MRMSGKIFVAVLTPVMLALAAETPIAGGQGDEAKPMIKRLLEFTDPGKTVEVVTGEEFALVLASNPTTGYSWQLAGEADPSILNFLGSDFIPPATPRVGAGGREVWRFLAVGSGRTAVTLRYLRPWEKDVPPLEEVSFQIAVRPGE